MSAAVLSQAMEAPMGGRSIDASGTGSLSQPLIEAICLPMMTIDHRETIFLHTLAQACERTG